MAATAPPGVPARDELILANLDLVQRIAGRYRSDDAIGDANLGLVQAATAYDAARGIPFAAYATHRIRGAVRDGQRRNDPLHRNDRRALSRGLDPADPADRQILARTASITNPLSLDMPIADQQDGLPLLLGGAIADPDADTERDALHRIQTGRLHAAIAALPARHRLIWHLRARDVTMTQIGQLLGVTESRVSQICRQIRQQLTMLDTDA